VPPRYSYWTILAGGLPTAFRAAERDDLMPTFKRIQEKHPDAEMKWFARGKLWESPEAAREDTEARRRPPDGQRTPTADRGPARPRENRGRDWRPGGEHRDPRQKFKDAKKDRNQDRRQQRFDRKQGVPRDKPHGDPLRRDVPPATRPPADRPAWRAQQSVPHKPEARDTRGGGEKRDWRDRPPREKPHGDPRRRDAPPAGRAPFKARPPFKRDGPPRGGTSGPAAPKPHSGGPRPAAPKPHGGGPGPATPKPRSGGPGPATPKPRSGEGGRRR
jgi:hypothetical protein